jgi:polyvinyl alcohol dehydrogenase (cytochrome)
VFVGGQDGSVYSLDAATGCVHWSTIVQAEVRSGMTVAEVAGKPTVFFGDSSGYYYALDGETGKQVWKLQPEEHPVTKGTATPAFYQGRLYISAYLRWRKPWRFHPATCAVHFAAANRLWMLPPESRSGSGT